jgi:hypothetical protein
MMWNTAHLRRTVTKLAATMRHHFFKLLRRLIGTQTASRQVSLNQRASAN